jgi:hypothetical protein
MFNGGAVKRKIGTVLDQHLIRRAKAHAGRRALPLSAVFEDALRAWLDQAEAKGPGPGLIRETAGNMAIEPAVLAALLAEDPYAAP